MSSSRTKSGNLKGLSKTKSGTYRKQLSCWDGKRREVRLGKNKKKAETLSNRMDQMNQSLRFNQPFDAELQSWLSGAPEEVKSKLRSLNLLPDSQDVPATVGGFTQFYIEEKKPNPASKRKLENAREKLIEKFGSDRLLSSISRGDAASFLSFLTKELKLSENHARRTVGYAKEFFTAAVDYRVISEEPFRKLSARVKANASRKKYIDVETSRLILEACPDAEWRLRFAMMRWLGLRCPSELNELRWEDVDWSGNRIRIRDKKRGTFRTPAIFPEILPYLEDAFELASPGAVYVLRRAANKNYREKFLKILDRAGIEPWPALFHNLRASAVTDAAGCLPSHVVNKWFGHCEAISQEFYRQLREDDYELVQSRTSALDTVPQKVTQQTSEKPAAAGKSNDVRSSEAFKDRQIQQAPENAAEHGTEKWAMRDSNPRHPRCKRGALAN